MKIRTIILSVVLTVMTVFAGCGQKNNTSAKGNNVIKHTTGERVDVTTEERFVIGQDSCYMFHMGNMNFIVKAENGYYFDLGGVLYYANENLKLTAMCDKPNCMHIRENAEEIKNCKAYMGATYMNNALQYYNNSVYFMAPNNLDTGEMFSNENRRSVRRFYSMNKDTCNRTLCDFYGGHSSPKAVIHRGYIYYIECVKKLDWENGGKVLELNNYIKRVSLETGEEEILMEERDGGQSWGQSVLAYRNYVYFVARLNDVQKTYVYSIADNKLVNMIEGIPLRGMWFMDDKLLFTRIDGMKEESRNAYVANLDGSEEKVAFCKHDYYGYLGADDKYIYEDNYVVDEVRKGSADRILRYYDKSTYECLGEINIGKTDGRQFGYGDEKYYFFTRRNENNSETWFYFDKNQIDTGNIEVKELFDINKLAD